jgi:hypothetical protein
LDSLPPPQMLRRIITGVLGSTRDGEERKRKRDDDDDDLDKQEQRPPPTKRAAPNLTALLKHPKNARIRLRNIGGVPALWYDGVRVYGLLRRLKAIFYPHYDYETARHVDTTVPESESKIPFPPDGARKGGKSHTLGAVRGSAVDFDLRLWVNNPAEFKRRPTHPPMCVDIIGAFEAWEWTGIVAQFPLVAEHIGIQTLADMIVSDSDASAILLEIKTGYENYLFRYSGMMKGPLSDLPDTPMNQHFLQLGTEKLIAQHCYGFRFPKSFVVQAINDRGVIPHPLPKWFLEREPQIWDYLCKCARNGVGEVASAAKDRGPTARAPRPVASRSHRGGFKRPKRRP